MMRRWLARGVDGFRMDVINLISKQVGPHGELEDGPVLLDGLGDGTGFFMNGPRIHEFLHEMHESALADRGLITVGETPGASLADAQLYTDPARREVDMVFTFEHMELDQLEDGTKWDLRPLRLPKLKANLTAWQLGLADRGWNSLYWDNHDQPRVVSRWGDDGEHRVASAKAWATVLHLLRGTPYVYQGEELGMTNAHFTCLDQYADIESLNWAREALHRRTPEQDVLRSLAVKSRDNARTPVQWTAGPHAGFTTGTPWLQVNANHTEVNAEAAIADPGSVFHHYRRLIGLRHEHEVVVDGDYRLLLPEHEQLFGYVRSLPDRRLLVLVNLSGDPATVDLGDDAGLLDGEVLLGGAAATLGPWEHVVTLTLVSEAPGSA
jgi:oligo-1,6-glucosidase